MNKQSDTETVMSPLGTIVRRGLSSYSRQKKLIVAVSGGADSVALLHLLIEAGHRNLVVAHFNHRLRGRESRADSLFVARLAERLGLHLEMGEGHVRKESKEKKVSVETAAREARYTFLGSVAKKHGTRTLLLAHHSDDQVETCLFNFLRGSGMAGLSGMKTLSERTESGIHLKLIRPLLSVSKEELIGWLGERRIRFREDASNSVADATRNKLRLKLLPVVEHLLGSSFRKAIVRNARILADENAFLAGIANPMALHEELRVGILREIHPALQRRVLHAWLSNNGVTSPGFSEVELLASMLPADGPAKVNLPGNRHARRRAGLLFIEQGSRKSSDGE